MKTKFKISIAAYNAWLTANNKVDSKKSKTDFASTLQGFDENEDYDFEMTNEATAIKNPLAVKAFEKMPISGNPESLNSNAILSKFGVSTSEEFEALVDGQTIVGKIKSFESLPFDKLNLQETDKAKAKANGLKEGVRYKLACKFQDTEKAVDFVLAFDRCLQSGTMQKLMEITGFVVGNGFEFRIERPNGSQWLQMTNIA